jgi:hypothetical protein
MDEELKNDDILNFKSIDKKGDEEELKVDSYDPEFTSI